MAEFRKLFYAFGLAALLTGASSTASAQTSTICNSNAGVPPIIRAESFSDLVGDYVLDCTGGVRTPSGQTVPQVNFTVTLGTQITSRLLTSNFTEALLIVDEPNSASNPGRPLLACGDDNAPDNTASGPGVCTIVSDGTFAAYSGAPGRPNVFQGRTGVAQNLNDSNIIVFAGVPFDPPGLGDQGQILHRYFRFTNIRANAPGVSSTFLLTQVLMNVNVNGSTSVAINNPQQVVASVQRGLIGPNVSGGPSWVQCIGQSNALGGTITFTEGFQSSFKTKGFEQIIANGTVVGGVYRYDGVNARYDLPASGTPYGGIRQNVPGANYNTESGFTNASTQALPSTYGAAQPPAGIGTTPVTSGTAAFDSTTNGAINTAGIATQGTRLAIAFKDIPAGVTVSVPLTVNLVRSGTSSVTGVARLVGGLDSQGRGAYSPATSGAVGSNSIVFYEVLFNDPFVIEDLPVQVLVSYSPNLASNLPEPFKTAQAAGGFAPFILPTDSDLAWRTASSTLPVPRFRNTISNYGNLFNITKCACNLLFPFATNLNTSVGNYDTGFAIANTSLLPSSTFGFNPGGNTAQEGTVQFWYYTAQSTNPQVTTQCTNTTTPGACPGNKVVKAGETLTYSLFGGSPVWGLDNRAAGFTGYVVVQTQFQYCHGFAYISRQGAGPADPGMSVGYLGLILDKNDALPQRTNQNGEALNQ